MSKGPSLQLLFVLLFVAAGCQQTGTPPSPPTQAEKAPIPPPEPATCSDCIPVTAENFPRAETDLYFGETVKMAGGIGKFYHFREPMPIDKQTVIRANRDTLYISTEYLSRQATTAPLPHA